MHIAEGVAPGPVAAVGAILAVAGVAVGLRAMRDEQIPRAALTAAAIFVAAVVVRLPLGPSSVHPILNGFAGLVLGWVAVPAFLVALLLQALLFQFGGITTLGLNTVTMAFPAVVSYYLFSRPLRRAGNGRMPFVLGVAAAVTALILSFVLWSIALILSGSSFTVLVKLALVPHLGLVVVEGLFTGFAVSFLVRVCPEVFEAPALMHRAHGSAGASPSRGMAP